MNRGSQVPGPNYRVLPLRWEQEIEHLAKEDSLFKLATLQHKENMLAFMKFEEWLQQIYDKLVSLCFDNNTLKDIPTTLSGDMKFILTELFKYKKSLFTILIDCHSYLVHVQEWLMKLDKSIALRKFHVADPNLIAGTMTRKIVSQDNTFTFLLWWIYHGGHLNNDPKLAENSSYVIGYKIRYKFHKEPIVTYFMPHNRLPAITFQMTKAWLPFLSQFHFADECLEASGLDSSEYCRFLTYCKALRPLLTRLHEIANIQDHDRQRRYLKLLVEKERIIMELTNELNFQAWQTSLKTTESNVIDVSTANSPLGPFIKEPEKEEEKKEDEKKEEDLKETEITNEEVEGIDGEIWKDERGQPRKEPEAEVEIIQPEKEEKKEEEKIPEREYIVRFGTQLYLRSPNIFGFGTDFKPLRNLNAEEIELVNENYTFPDKVVRNGFLYHRVPFDVPEGYALKEIGFLTPAELEAYEREKKGLPPVEPGAEEKSSSGSREIIPEEREVKADIPSVTQRPISDLLAFRPDLVTEHILDTIYRTLTPFIESPNKFANFVVINQARASYLAYTFQNWFRTYHPDVSFKRSLPDGTKDALSLTEFNASNCVCLDTTYVRTSLDDSIMTMLTSNFDTDRFSKTILSFHKRAKYVEASYALNGTLWDRDDRVFEQIRNIYQRNHTLQRNDHLHHQICEMISRVVSVFNDFQKEREWVEPIRTETKKILERRNAALNERLVKMSVYPDIETFFKESYLSSSFISDKIPEIMEHLKQSIRYNALAAQLSNFRHDFMFKRANTNIEKEVNNVFMDLTPTSLVNEIGVVLFKKMEIALQKASIEEATSGRAISDEAELKEVFNQFKTFCVNVIFNVARQLNEQTGVLESMEDINLLIKDYVEFEHFLNQKESQELVDVLSSLKETLSKFNTHHIFKSTISFQDLNNQLSKFIKKIPSQSKEFLIFFDYVLSLRDTALELCREISSFIQEPTLLDPSSDTWFVSIIPLHESLLHTIMHAKLDILSASSELAYLMASQSQQFYTIRESFDQNLVQAKESLIPQLTTIQKLLLDTHPNAEKEVWQSLFQEILIVTQKNAKNVILIGIETVEIIVALYFKEYISISTQLFQAIQSHLTRTSEKLKFLREELRGNLTETQAKESKQTADDFLLAFHPIFEALNVPHEPMIYSIYNTLVYYERAILKYVTDIGILYKNAIKSAFQPLVSEKKSFEAAKGILEEIELKTARLVKHAKETKSKTSSLNTKTAQVNYEKIMERFTKQLGGKGASSVDEFKEWYSHLIMMGEEELEKLRELCEELITEMFNEIDYVSLSVPFRSTLVDNIQIKPTEKHSVEYNWRIINEEFVPEIKENILPELDVFKHGRIWTTIIDSFDDNTKLQPSSSSDWGKIKEALTSLSKDLIYTLNNTLQEEPTSLLKMYYISYIFFSHVSNVVRSSAPYLLQHSSLSIVRLFSLLDTLWSHLRGFITKLLSAIILLVFSNNEKIDIENLVRPMDTYPTYKHMDPFPPTQAFVYDLLIPETVRHIFEIIPTDSVSQDMNILVNEVQRISTVFQHGNNDFKRDLYRASRSPTEKEILADFWMWSWIESICMEDTTKAFQLESTLIHYAPNVASLNFRDLRTWIRGSFSLLIPETRIGNLHSLISSVNNPKTRDFLTKIAQQNIRLSRAPFPNESFSMKKQDVNQQQILNLVNDNLEDLIARSFPVLHSRQRWISWIQSASEILDVLNNRTELRDKNFLHTFMLCMVSDIHVQENWFSFLKLLPPLGPRVSSFSRISSIFKLFSFSIEDILLQVKDWYDSINFHTFIPLILKFASRYTLDVFHPIVLSKIYMIICESVDTFKHAKVPYLIFIDDCNELFSMFHYFFFFKQYDLFSVNHPFVSNATGIQKMLLELTTFQQTLKQKRNKDLISHIVENSSNKTKFSEFKRIAIIESQKSKENERNARLTQSFTQISAEVNFRYQAMLDLESNQEAIDKNVEGVEETDAIYFHLKTAKTMAIHLNEMAVLTLQKIDLYLRDALTSFNNLAEQNLLSLALTVDSIFSPLNDIIVNTHKYISKENTEHEFSALSMRILLIQMADKLLEMNSAVDQPERIVPSEFDHFNTETISKKMGFPIETPKHISSFFGNTRHELYLHLHDVLTKVRTYQREMNTTLRELEENPQFSSIINEYLTSISTRFDHEVGKIKDTIWSFNTSNIALLGKSIDARIGYIDQILRDWQNLVRSVKAWHESGQSEALTEDFLLKLSVSLDTRPNSSLKRGETETRLIELLEISTEERLINIFLPILEGLLTEITTL